MREQAIYIGLRVELSVFSREGSLIIRVLRVERRF
jgi:hypothetical protein